MLTFAALHQAKRERRLHALLDTAEARIEAAQICAANDPRQRAVSFWMDTLREYVLAELDAIAAERDTAIALAEIAADAAAEREALILALLEAGAETAACHLEHGATWAAEPDGWVTVQRYGGERHEVSPGGRCGCSAAQFGRTCWALAVAAMVKAPAAAGRRAA